MASIPTNGYAEVMAGTNNYSGSNSYDGSCPRTAIPPVIGDDLCNKTYVDAGGGGLIGLLTDKGSLITADGTQAVIFDQNPYQSALTTTTVYDWNSLAVAQSRNFTTTTPTSIPLGASITITYSGTDSITGTITAIAGTTITLTITALASTPYPPAVLLQTSAAITYASGLLINPLPYVNADTTPIPPVIQANSIITQGEVFFYSSTGQTVNITIGGTSIQRAVSTNGVMPIQPAFAPPPPAVPTALFWNGANGGCFVGATQQVGINIGYSVGAQPTWGLLPSAPDFQARFIGSLTGYTLTYNTGAITITGDIALLADPVSTTGLKWGVVSGGGGGGIVNSVVGGTNIVMSGSSTAPVVNLRNPLTAVLSLGTQNITGTTGNMTLINLVGTSQSILSANQLRIQDTTVAANGILATETGLVVSGAAGGETLTYGSSNIVKTGGQLGISAPTGIAVVAGIGVTINSGTAPVQITQPVNTTPKLTTNIANVSYYADYVVDNNNSTAPVAIPPPNYNGQRLTCIARGVAPATNWVPFGNLATTANPIGVFTTYVATTGEVWLSRVDSNKIEIWDNNLTVLQAQIAVTGGDARVYCFFEEGGYMFFGGAFNDVAGTSQDGIGRVNVGAPYTVDKMNDVVNTIQGVVTTNVGAGVYSLATYGGYLYAGGTFITFTPTASPANYICRIDQYSNPAPNTQIYDWVDGGTNSTVNILLSAGGNLLLGGSFNIVAFGTVPLTYNFLASWNGFIYDFCDNNNINGAVSELNYTNTNYIFVGGSFSHSTQPHSLYIDGNVPTAANIASGLTSSVPLTKGSYYYGGGSNWVSIGNGEGVYKSTLVGTWVADGVPANATPSFIGLFGGTLNVAYSSVGNYFKQMSVAQEGIFTLTSGNFEYNNNSSFTTATLTFPDTAQSWIGVDVATAPKWIQIVYNPFLVYS